MRRAQSVLLAFAAVTLGAPPPAGTSDPGDLIAHEWGTFTSVAGEDGRAVEWLPLAGPSDLPCFVNDRSRWWIKRQLSGTVRMETPVIYFYATADTRVDVRVRFRQGQITEWYPRADVTSPVVSSTVMRKPGFEGLIEWRDIDVLPRGRTDFPTNRGASHYYAARETDASPIQVGAEREKFLFYRGVASFTPPVAARVSGNGSIVVTSVGDDALGDVILFENRAGRISYEVRRGATVEATFPAGVPEGTIEPLFAELRAILIANELYPKEADAMIATWRDSWFEEGTRVLYVVPPAVVDAILPLDIDPRPRDVARVFVGRVEIVTPAMLRAVQAAITASDDGALRKYGRFLRPIAERLLARSTPAERAVIADRVSSSATWSVPAACN